MATWEVGQTVDVQSRTWAGINKPGGCAKIINIRYSSPGIIEGLDVKYVVGGGCEKSLDPAIVSKYEELQRRGRKRRGRDFLVQHVKVQPSENKPNKKKAKTKPKQKPPSPQRTAPSTPGASSSSPDNPPKEVTPIPSYVSISTETALEVSPLDRNSALTESKKDPVARRGLFEPCTASPTTGVNPIKKKLKAVAAAAVASSKSISQKNKHKITYSTPRNTNLLRKSPQKKKNPVNFQLPRPNAPGSNTADAAGKSVPLKRVFEKEKEKARAFIDKVMGVAKNNYTDQILDTKPPAQPSRYEQFMSTFQKIRLRSDDEAILETQFRSRVSTDFSSSEIDAFLAKLEANGKFMKSEGTIYFI